MKVVLRHTFLDKIFGGCFTFYYSFPSLQVTVRVVLRVVKQLDK